MSFENPTPLRIGMTGTVSGKRFGVAGRVVMGVEEEGTTYYWNEFNLTSLEGDSATLVFEVTEHGGEWRLFTLFEPQFPITAQDAAAKQVGDPVNLEGTDTRVTLVEESRVYHIEGEAPEGVEVGDVARYFNAEAGDTMIVVSWTGEEVECYLGVNLAYADVRNAFNLDPTFEPAASSFGSLEGSPEEDSSSMVVKRVLQVVLVVLVALLGYGLYKKKAQVALVRTSAPACRLRVSSVGELDGRTYRVQARRLARTAQVGRVDEQNELLLDDGSERIALLVNPWNPGQKDWCLFTPLTPLNAMTPQEAAGKTTGENINLDGYVGPISRVFQTTIRDVSTNSAAPGAGQALYGFSFVSGSTPILVRWNQDEIAFYRGRVLPAREVERAFESERPR